MRYQPDLSNIPPSLISFTKQQWERIEPSLASVTLAENEITALTKVVVGSDFVVEQFISKPTLLSELLSENGLFEPYSQAQYAQTLAKLIADVDDQAALEKQLRVFRQREMVRLIWRDLNRSADTLATIKELSALADTCVNESLKKLYHWLCLRHGVPYSYSQPNCPAEQQYMVVIGMGKLGAAELNLSSDIDLMFCYPKNGETVGQKKSLDNQEFFIRLGKQLIKALDAPTPDGFVFRVDMRLRPFGSVSPLASSFNAMESYYQNHGREWERYAMIKARVIAGESPQTFNFMQSLKPFVYRKYIDYSAFESLREMKAMINSEVRRKGLTNNVKLGSGGIREIEFIGQAFQLIRGGRDARLQTRGLLNILDLLPETVSMPELVVAELRRAYLFLRDTEHAIQAIADKQTQELPIQEREMLRIAVSLGFNDSESFNHCLTGHREKVSQHFSEILAPAEEEHQQTKSDADWLLLWQQKLSVAEAEELCAEKGFDDAAKASKLISDLAQSKAMSLLQPLTVNRLKQVMPLLITQASEVDNSSQTLERVIKIVSAILRRSAYLVLLIENPNALLQLVKLCSASHWFAQVLTKQPVLLDELITPQTLYSPPGKRQLESELSQQMLRIPEDDEEQLMDSLRYFKHAHVLKIAASDITGVLPLMKVSDYLTWLAEAILHKVLDIAWRTLVAKHGVPSDKNGEEYGRNFIVIGYGKMGGIELSYGSDLDLVFLHGADSNALTNGEKSIPNAVFYTRLGQRVIHILNTFTANGQLYEIDMRLRPAGNSGMLVSPLSGFKAYQLNEAWTWEHQALVRARVVSGSESLANDFALVRKHVLEQQRDALELSQAVSEMREKMRVHLGSSQQQQSHQFNLKQDAGGIVDIEFLVQYYCLAYAYKYPKIIEYTDNVRILDALEKAALLDVDQAETLREAYKAFRAMGHRQAMQEQPSTINANLLKEHRVAVAEIWKKLVNDSPRSLSDLADRREKK